MSLKYHKKCICEYDGTSYNGWQRQEGLPTIQDEIEHALSLLYNGERIPITASGRTDAGVHALGQVFHFSSDIYRNNHSVVAALNSILPRNIAMLSAEDVAEDFHAQFSVINKTYKYIILNRMSRAALDTHRAWFRRDRIDEMRMCTALKYLEGTHDFTSFCLKSSLKENCVRTINFTDVQRDGDYITIRLNATGFLHNMVRIIVGTVTDLALNKRSMEYINEILEAKDRRRGGLTAPAHGLYLEKVYYS